MCCEYEPGFHPLSFTVSSGCPCSPIMQWNGDQLLFIIILKLSPHHTTSDLLEWVSPFKNYFLSWFENIIMLWNYYFISMLVLIIIIIWISNWHYRKGVFFFFNDSNCLKKMWYNYGLNGISKTYFLISSNRLSFKMTWEATTFT